VKKLHLPHGHCVEDITPVFFPMLDPGKGEDWKSHLYKQNIFFLIMCIFFSFSWMTVLNMLGLIFSINF